ncbi:MAG: ABC transporter permease [Tissierellia bacterium]|nr:ABC transporter permease [Tissierellia bacterium]
MSNFDLFSLAFRNLWRRKSRTILTVLSVVIGTFSIIMMVSLGNGMKRQQEQMIESIGGLNTITVMPQDMGSKQKEINNATMTQIRKNPHVKTIIPFANVSVNLTIDGIKDSFIGGNVKAIANNTLKEITQEQIEQGDILKANDKMGMIFGNQVEVYDNEAGPIDDKFSQKYLFQLGFEDTSPMATQTEKPQSKKIEAKLVGILSKKSDLASDSIYISEKTLGDLEKENKKLENPTELVYSGNNKNQSSNSSKRKYYSAEVVVDDIKNVDEVEKELKDMDFQTQSMKQIVDQMSQGTNTVQYIFAGIGSVAFIVSAIGIVNTMLMSIYERRKEIGVMKVIGASVSDVRNMFLVEAGFIGLLGGIVGLFFSFIASNAINKIFMNAMVQQGMEMTEDVQVSYIPWYLYIIATIFAFLVGVIAGYLPARRATKLKAIDSLRSD